MKRISGDNWISWDVRSRSCREEQRNRPRWVLNPRRDFPQQSTLASGLRTSSRGRPIIWRFLPSFLPQHLIAFFCPWPLLTPSVGELSYSHLLSQTQPVKGQPGSRAPAAAFRLFTLRGLGEHCPGSQDSTHQSRSGTLCSETPDIVLPCCRPPMPRWSSEVGPRNLHISSQL